MKELSWEQIEKIYDQFVPRSYFPFSSKLYQIYGLLPAPRYYTRYHGAVSNLPDSAIVEVAAMVDRAGPRPFCVGPLPKSVLGYQYGLILSEELAIDAALSGSRNDLLKAILAHPLAHSVAVAEKCMDELLHPQKEWLPQFYSGGVVNP
jgi:alpha-galactosidase/6-phospho-beta-glucosidase family protein